MTFKKLLDFEKEKYSFFEIIIKASPPSIVLNRARVGREFKTGFSSRRNLYHSLYVCNKTHYSNESILNKYIVKSVSKGIKFRIVLVWRISLIAIKRRSDRTRVASKR